MTELLGDSWYVVAALTAGSVLAMLYTLASVVRNQTHVHDLHVNVARLRNEYRERARAMQEAAATGSVQLAPAGKNDQTSSRSADAAGRSH